MSSTIGDYLFWKLSSIGACQVLGRGQRTLFIGSIQRNRLTYIDITRYGPTLSPTEVGVFVVSSEAADLSACFQSGRQYFSGRPMVFVQELGAGEYRSAPDLTTGLTFAAATVLNYPATAASQIDQVLNTMLYESKPVYVGIAPAVAGTVITVPTRSTSGSGSATSRSSTGYSVTPGEVNAASAAIAMSFIR